MALDGGGRKGAPQTRLVTKMACSLALDSRKMKKARHCRCRRFLQTRQIVGNQRLSGMHFWNLRTCKKGSMHACLDGVENFSSV